MRCCCCCCCCPSTLLFVTFMYTHHADYPVDEKYLNYTWYISKPQGQSHCPVRTAVKFQYKMGDLHFFSSVKQRYPFSQHLNCAFCATILIDLHRFLSNVRKSDKIIFFKKKIDDLCLKVPSINTQCKFFKNSSTSSGLFIHFSHFFSFFFAAEPN